MKVKEIPKSLYQSFRLRNLPVGKLLQTDREALPLIVSLTSIPERLGSVDLVIRSLLDQASVPQKICLWLPDPLKGQVPESLAKLVHDRFEIAFSPLTCPHKKLIHTLERYPEGTIVTCDDDLMYPSQWLGSLYQAHLNHPKDIIGHQIRYIGYDADGKLLPYSQWVLPPGGAPDPRRVLAIGAGGVLYPPRSLDPRVQDRALFMKLSPRADDLWFKMMGLLVGTKTRGTDRKPGEPVPIMGSQKTSLKHTNIKADENRKQWLQLTEYFGIRP